MMIRFSQSLLLSNTMHQILCINIYIYIYIIYIYIYILHKYIYYKATVGITRRAHCFHDYIYLLHWPCFCEIWVFCMSQITCDHLYINIYTLPQRYQQTSIIKYIYFNYQGIYHTVQSVKI